MFEKSKGNNPREPEPQSFGSASDPTITKSEPAARMTAMIGPTITIKGDISGDENLVIDGKVEGSVELRGKDLTIGQSGNVRANVAASVVKIDGEVKGDISGQEKVILSRTGRVQGNIVAPRVTLEDGAKFKGSIDMDPTERAADAPKSSYSSAGKGKPTVAEKVSGEAVASAVK